MRVIAVPVKSLDQAKSRLAPLLSLPERRALVLAMLEDVLDACREQRGWEVWAVSRDEVVLEIAVRRGARPVVEEGRSLLAAVRQVEAEMAAGFDDLAVVLADLPYVSADALARGLQGEAAVAAAPSSSDGGTNLLVRRPATVIAARFGPASFAKHRWGALRAGAAFADVRSPQLGFDLDRPADVADVLASGRACRARSVCLEMGLGERVRALA